MARTGAERTDVAVVWPSRLLRSQHTRLVYLDLNHWIGLAKAAVGHWDGKRFSTALEAVLAHRDGWTYVIGGPLMMELTGILRRQQRQDLGQIIEELTGYSCVMPLTTIAALELETALCRATGTAERFEAVPLIGRGVLQALGLRGGMRVRDRDGNDVTDQARREAPGGAAYFDQRIGKAERDLDRSVIRGPADDTVEEELRRDGWDPSGARRGAEQRAQQEQDFALQLAEDPQWRRGRLRDVIAARYLALEIESIREDALRAHEVRLSEVLTSVEAAREFTDAMPAADTWITLRTAKHRNPDSAWKPNDIFDIDALSVVAPYCDVVVTERHSAHVLRQADAPRRYGTTLLTSLDELADHVSTTTD
ncbi:hypothetical protein [Baekduia sp. Peel2402]|uniref:hypothetical protein n=1 Tax=Baekduia sp. Peel2402 TaxID=3458296 RepID=UPI00403E95B7